MASGRSVLYEDFLAFERRHALLPNGGRVLACVSGGPDSVALLDILHNFSKGGRIELYACHLNHQLRGVEAQEDAAFVKRLCDSMGVQVEVGARDVAALAKEKGLSIETAARDARYEFFNSCARRFKCNTVATAHTMSDDAETVLMRLIEGAGPEGLTGIPVKRPLGKRTDLSIVRPLLFAARPRIEQYLAERRLEYRVDKSNLEPIYLRNRIRLEVIPRLKELNPSIEEALARTAESIDRMYDLVGREIGRAWRRVVENDKGPVYLLRRAELLKVHPAVATEIVKEILVRAGLSERNLRSAHMDAVMDLAESRKPSGRLELPDGVEARRDYDSLLIAPAREFPSSRRQEMPEAFEEMLDVDGSVELPRAGRIEARRLNELSLDDFVARKGKDEEVVDARALKGALRVRFPRRGDRYRPLGAPGERKLSDVFIDARLPAADRAAIPVVEDDKGIVYVGGLRIAHRAKVGKKTTRYVLLRWRRPEGE